MCPFYIRAGKNLPVTCTEVMARLRKPPTTNIAETDVPQNYTRFRISPEMTVAMAVSVSPPTGLGGERRSETGSQPPSTARRDGGVRAGSERCHGR